MAVSSATSWADTTEVVASSTATRLKSVVIRCNPDSAADSSVQLWNHANPTPGTTAPDFAILVPSAAKMGRELKLNVPFGGIYCDTGLTWFVSTTAGGGTAATTNAPLLVDVHYTPGG